MAVTEARQRAQVGPEQWVLGEYPEPVLIPKERYTSEEFLALEYEKLWLHVWQMACRQEEIPHVGDYLEYTIGDRSVLIVRSGKDTIKGYHNACLHRGRALKEGCGSAREIRCGYHAWRWNLDGTIKEVVDPETFHPDAIRPEDLRLPEVRVERWGGFVFINFDHNAEPLREFLAGLPGYFDPTLPEEFRLLSARTLVFDANWKNAMEAFVEGYHAQGTHQQTLWWVDDTFYQAGPPKITGRHSSVSGEYGAQEGKEVWTFGTYSPRLGPDLQIDPRWAVLQARREVGDQRGLMVAPEDLEIAETVAKADLPDGINAHAYFAMKVIEDFQAKGIKVPPLLAAPEFMIFPNMTVASDAGRTWWLFRFRPYGMDPDKCFFDLFTLRRFPEGHEPTVVREFHDPALSGDDERDVAEYGLIMFQDLRNIPHVQKGLHSLQQPGVRPGALQEGTVRHLHEQIDGYLTRDWD